MSNDEPTRGQQPEDDPFLKKPRQPGDPGQPPPQDAGSGGSRATPPYGAGGPSSGGGGPQGGPYGQGPGGPGPQGPYGRDPYGGAPFGSAPDPLAGMPPLAPFGRRLAARIIDVLVVAIPLAVISLAANGFDFSTSNGESEWDSVSNDVNSGTQWLWTLVLVVAYVGYDTLMTRWRGQTLGKRWMGLRVGMLADGSVPGTNPALLRALVLWVPAVVCCYFIWWIVIGITILTARPYRQGLHDKAGRTVVVVTTT
jgi:uncharacterized RDD family membrane protein YckC